MQNNHAFTFVEILIVMAVLVILGVVTGANYKRIFSQQELVASAQQLHQFLNLAKLQAIKNNQQTYVNFCQQGTSEMWRMALSDQNNCDCFEMDDTSPNSCSVNGEQFNQLLTDGHFVLVQKINFNVGVSPVTRYTSYKAMRFSTDTGRVTLKDSDGKYTLSVKQSIMRISICGEGGAQLGYPSCD